MGRKRQKVSRSSISTNQVDMHLKNQRRSLRRGNSFELLSENMNADPTPSSSKMELPSTSKPQKPPPVVIDTTSADFTKVIDHIGTDGYFFRRTSLGTKVFSCNMEKYKHLLNGLKSTPFRYFTHRVVDNSSYKMVLKGLHKVSTELIKEELETNHGVKCVDIKEIITTKSSPNDALYLLTFNRMHVNKKVLHSIKYIQRVAILWKNQKSKPDKGPTQCHKCGLYGHGTENCHRQQICFLCSSITHSTTYCPMNNATGGKIFKCFNCVAKCLPDFAHRADDPHCPSRTMYIEARLNATKRNTTNQRRVAEPSFVTAHGNQQQSNVPILNGLQSSPTCSKQTYAGQFKPRNDLFSMDELLTIFQKATVELKKCTTKLDQLNIIVSLLKHAV